MNSDTVLAIALGIGVPLVVIMIVGIIFLILRGRSRNPIHQGYDKVNHDLDDEEIEFQRMIESKHGISDEDFGLDFDDVGDGGDGLDDIDAEDLEFGFSAKDKDRLSMLEKLRSNLVAGAGADMDHHHQYTDENTKRNGHSGEDNGSSTSVIKEDMRL